MNAEATPFLTASRLMTRAHDDLLAAIPLAGWSEDRRACFESACESLMNAAHLLHVFGVDEVLVSGAPIEGLSVEHIERKVESPEAEKASQEILDLAKVLQEWADGQPATEPEIYAFASRVLVFLDVHFPQQMASDRSYEESLDGPDCEW